MLNLKELELAVKADLESLTPQLLNQWLADEFGLYQLSNIQLKETVKSSINCTAASIYYSTTDNNNVLAA